MRNNRIVLVWVVAVDRQSMGEFQHEFWIHFDSVFLAASRLDNVIVRSHIQRQVIFCDLCEGLFWVYWQAFIWQILAAGLTIEWCICGHVMEWHARNPHKQIVNHTGKNCNNSGIYMALSADPHSLANRPFPAVYRGPARLNCTISSIF